jgi:hypothetical protein
MPDQARHDDPSGFFAGSSHLAPCPPESLSPIQAVYSHCHKYVPFAQQKRVDIDIEIAIGIGRRNNRFRPRAGSGDETEHSSDKCDNPRLMHPSQIMIIISPQVAGGFSRNAIAFLKTGAQSAKKINSL